MRVPMWVISPWSRGGWVNSQVFDHTSALRFLEQRFGVVEPNISAFRRAVCGDLTSTLNFVSPNSAALPTLPGRTTKTDADGLTTWQEAQPAIAVPTQQTLAKQAPGTRPSRALPYELHTSAREEARENRVRLLFANASSGQAATVFHVYDKLHLDRIPRRYVVEAGKSLEDAWDVSGDSGKYDLWVLGPNGYHRAFAGDLMQTGGAQPETQVCYVPCDDPQVQVKLHNNGSQPCTFTVRAMAYRSDVPWTATVQAGQTGELSWPVGDSGQWYDFAVACDGYGAFQRRFAGRMETGKDGVSDPAMGQVN